MGGGGAVGPAGAAAAAGRGHRDDRLAGGAGGDRVRADHGVRLAAPAAGVRGGGAHRAPPVRRLDPGRVLAPATYRCAGPARCPGPGRLVAGDRRRRPRASDKGGELTGANPVDRSKAGSKVHVDNGYDYPHIPALLRDRGIAPRVARRGVEASTRLGRYRWVIERTIAWLVGYRRLTIRYERFAKAYCAFLTLAAALTCHKHYLKHAT